MAINYMLQAAALGATGASATSTSESLRQRLQALARRGYDRRKDRAQREKRRAQQRSDSHRRHEQEEEQRLTATPQ